MYEAITQGVVWKGMSHTAVKVVATVSPAALVTVPDTTFIGKDLYLKIRALYTSRLAQC